MGRAEYIRGVDHGISRKVVDLTEPSGSPHAPERIGLLTVSGGDRYPIV